MQSRFYVFLLLLFLSFQTRASHIVGGEISLQYIQNRDYQITLNLYFDLINGDPSAQDPAVQIAFYDKATNDLLDTVLILRSNFYDIQTQKGVCSYIKLQTRKITYSGYIRLNKAYDGSQGFYAAWARCCRNSAIVNIKNPQSAATVFYSEFAPISKLNSSPEFAAPDTNGFACLNIPFSYDFSATDSDGDQLKYDLVIPLNGNLSPALPGGWASPAPYQTVILQTGFTLNNLIPGSIPLQVNPNTGELKFTATVPGLFVFSVRCSEYRNGVYLGSVRKDYQLLVVTCAIENTKPQLNAINPNTNSIYNPLDKITIYNSKTSCISLFAYDTVQGQKLTVTYIGSNFINFTISPNLYITKSNNDTAHYTMCIPDCILNGDSTLKVKLILTNENNCTLPRYDTLIATLKNRTLKNDLNITLDNLNNPNVDVLINRTLNFSVSGLNSDSNYIKLYSRGVGFLLKNKKMIFSSATGFGSIQSEFSYLAECQDLKDSPYQVWFITKDSSCFTEKYDSILVKINVVDTSINYDISLVNIITPNGDHVNDTFELHNLPVDNCTEIFSSVDIYNRWGNKVFSDNKRTFKWEASDVADGLYYYQVKYNKKILKSWLQVSR